MPNTIVHIGADHRGFELKAKFISWLREHGFDPKDVGTHSAERCDALDFARKLAQALPEGSNQFGVLICGSGQAMAMTANRYRHLRAALCTDVTLARLSRQHNDANVLALGADIIGGEVAIECLEVFLKTEFLGGRYAERRQRLIDLGGL